MYVSWLNPKWSREKTQSYDKHEVQPYLQLGQNHANDNVEYGGRWCDDAITPKDRSRDETLKGITRCRGLRNLSVDILLGHETTMRNDKIHACANVNAGGDDIRSTLDTTNTGL